MPLDQHNPRQAAIFYAIALTLAVAIALSDLFGEGSPVVTMLTPAIAVAVLMLADGTWRNRAAYAALGVTTLGRNGWWLAILGPAAILLLSDAALVAAGVAALKTPEFSGSAAQIAGRLTLGLCVGLVFAFAEEVGWRGYLLPRLVGFGLLPAMLIAGLLHGAWHLPLLLATPYYHSGGNPLFVVPLFMVTLTLAGVFYGYLRVLSGSVWPVAAAHAVYNFFWGLGSEFIAPMRPDTMEYVGGESGLLVIVGLLIFTIVLAPQISRIARGV